MKPALLSLLAIGVVMAGLTAFAQNTSQPNPQVAPNAWCDRNGDGICDVTGIPVGQGRGMGAAMACPYRQSAQSLAPSAQPAPAPAK